MSSIIAGVNQTFCVTLLVTMPHLVVTETFLLNISTRVLRIYIYIYICNVTFFYLLFNTSLIPRPFWPDKVEDEASVLFDCFMYGNIRNAYINKAQNISLQDQMLSVLKCTDESSLVVFEKCLFIAAQMHNNKKTTLKLCICIVVHFWCLKDFG